ncbi:MAG: hypothetical protein MHMPM18_002372 [Marteilia pararefringens]
MANCWDDLDIEQAVFTIFVMLPEILVVLLLAPTKEFKNGVIWIMVPCVLALSMVFCAACVLISDCLTTGQKQQLKNSIGGYCQFNWCKYGYIAIWIFLLLLCLTQCLTLIPALLSRFKTKNGRSFGLSAISSVFDMLLIGYNSYLYITDRIRANASERERANDEERDRYNHYDSNNNIARQMYGENAQNENSEII